MKYIFLQTWDEELAATAQRWSDQCITAHDQASQREVSRFPVGQNLAATWTTRPPSDPSDSQPDFMKQINAWFDEVRLFGFKPINGGHSTGHYSQVKLVIDGIKIVSFKKYIESFFIRSELLHCFILP